MSSNLINKTIIPSFIAAIVLVMSIASPVQTSDRQRSLLSSRYRQQQQIAQNDPMKCHKGEGRCGWRYGSHYGRMYDINTVETIAGKVVSVNNIIATRGRSGGVHLRVKTGNETVEVHLGPSWYLQRQNFRIKQNETIEVRGSRVSFEGEPTIIAARVKKEDATLTLRNENGFPMWSGWRRQGRFN